MGFMDKAKKFAQEAQQQAKDGTLKDKAKGFAQQAQQKLDEVQGQFNESQKGAASEGPVVEYDKHGRPIKSDDAAPQPVSEETVEAVQEAAIAETEPEAVPTEAAARAGGSESPVQPAAAPPTAPPPASGEVDRSADEPPPMTSGDPLAG